MNKWIALCTVSMLVLGNASAQDSVPYLEDLVGAKGRDGEAELERRGYAFIRSESSGDSVYSYWQEQENGQCVVVRTFDGRYASIAPAMEMSCDGGSGGQSKSDREDAFDTVCGVMVGGEDYAYRCRVVDVYAGGRKTETTLQYPDQTIRLRWGSRDHLEIQFEGMRAMDGRYSTSEGETNFLFEDKTYYYFSDKGRARSEVQNFRD